MSLHPLFASNDAEWNLGKFLCSLPGVCLKILASLNERVQVHRHRSFSVLAGLLSHTIVFIELLGHLSNAPSQSTYWDIWTKWAHCIFYTCDSHALGGGRMKYSVLFFHAHLPQELVFHPWRQKIVMLQQDIQSFDWVVSLARCLENREEDPPTAEDSMGITFLYGITELHRPEC